MLRKMLPSVLIGASVGALLFSLAVVGSRAPTGRYQFTLVGDGPPIIYRMDTGTGEIQVFTGQIAVDKGLGVVKGGKIPGWKEMGRLEVVEPLHLADLRGARRQIDLIDRRDHLRASKFSEREIQEQLLKEGWSQTEAARALSYGGRYIFVGPEDKKGERR